VVSAPEPAGPEEPEAAKDQETRAKSVASVLAEKVGAGICCSTLQRSVYWGCVHYMSFVAG